MTEQTSLQTIVDASEKAKRDSKLALLRLDRALARFREIIEARELNERYYWIEEPRA